MSIIPISLASLDFEPGPPGEEAVELARVVDRGIRESKTIDLKQLCITPGEKVFVVFIDVYVINHAGNLIDASALAAVAALMNTKMFNYELKAGDLKIKSGYKPLPILRSPITITFAKVGEMLFIDPCLDEEKVIDARLSIAFDNNGDICAIQKGGSGYFASKQILEIAKKAKNIAENTRKKLGW